MNPAKKFFSKLLYYLSDSALIYTVLLNCAVMYYYRESLTPLWFILSLAAAGILFGIFDYVAKHKYIGFFSYVILFFVSIYAMFKAIQKGSENYQINFLLWFITTQDALEYNKWYTIAMFIFFILFFSSVVYYFTKIRYRISMGFLVFLIPFVIYGKEASQMPAAFIILLSVMCVVNMIKFNNIRNGDKSIKVGKKNILLSTALYVLTFGITASVLPKPNIQADRTYLESLINMDAFTDMLISKINIFNNEANSGKFNSLTTNDNPLYYAKSDEPLRLKTQVFTDYDFSSDKWTFNYDDYYFSSSCDCRDPSEIVKLIVLCSELDKDFAKKYNISDVSGNIPDADKKELHLYSTGYSSDLLPVPSWLIDSDEPDYIQREFSNFGTVKAADESFPSNTGYSINYYSDSFIYNADVYKILTSLSYNEVTEMYGEMCSILYENNIPDKASIMEDAVSEAYLAADNLNYGDSEKIYNLAMQITDSLSSDYEKALAIENYFLANDYIYDLTYRKDSDENAETFLFDTKRGVCYEYATAMVLLSRACGIPARYAEGYNMSQPYGDGTETSSKIPDYVIRIRDAHGFPELYIAGIGWTSFEPTVSDTIIDYEKTDVSKGMYISGIVLAVLLLAGLLLLKFYPAIYNWFFMIKIKKSDPAGTVSLVFIRVRQLFGFGKDVTAKELCNTLISENQTDISALENLFEKSSYGNISPNEKDKEDVIKLYSDLYDKFKKSKKFKK